VPTGPNMIGLGEIIHGGVPFWLWCKMRPLQDLTRSLRANFWRHREGARFVPQYNLGPLLPLPFIMMLIIIIVTARTGWGRCLGGRPDRPLR
jgi:hypothetical protein